MMKRSTQSRERSQRGDFVPFHLPLAGSRGGAPLWGLGQRHNCCSSSLLKKRSQQSAGNEASLPVTLRIRRCAPQLALSITSTLSRPLARPSGSSFLIMLAHCDTQGFRLCGGEGGGGGGGGDPFGVHSHVSWFSLLKVERACERCFGIVLANFLCC